MQTLSDGPFVHLSAPAVGGLLRFGPGHPRATAVLGPCVLGLDSLVTHICTILIVCVAKVETSFRAGLDPVDRGRCEEWSS